MKLLRLVLGAIGIAAALAVVLAAPAAASVQGNCRATVAGVDVTTRSADSPADAIKVNWDQDVPIQFTAAAPITGYAVVLTYAGISWPAAQGGANGTIWNNSVQVRSYAPYGVGLYQVAGQLSGPGACSGGFMVDIVGKNPLTTAAGLAGAALSLVGVCGLIGAGITAFTTALKAPLLVL